MLLTVCVLLDQEKEATDLRKISNDRFKFMSAIFENSRKEDPQFARQAPPYLRVMLRGLSHSTPISGLFLRSQAILPVLDLVIQRQNVLADTKVGVLSCRMHEHALTLQFAYVGVLYIGGQLSCTRKSCAPLQGCTAAVLRRPPAGRSRASFALAPQTRYAVALALYVRYQLKFLL